MYITSMTHKIKAILLICAAVSAMAAAARPSAINIPRSRGANIGILIRDLQTGNDIVSEIPDTSKHPEMRHRSRRHSRRA